MNGVNADCSVARLLEYCDELGASGQWNKNTASAMKTACERLLVGLSPDEMQDVRRVDVDGVARKYTNKKIAKPDTCREYRRRVLAAITKFKEHMDDIETGKASCSASPITEIDKSTGAEIEKPARVKPSHIPREAPGSKATTLEIPVRSDFKAQLVLPYDLTPSEAKRLCKLIEALPISEG